MGQQLAQAELRMGRLQFLPAWAVEVAVETGKHHRARGKMRDDVQKLRRRRDRARRARGNHRGSRRVPRELGSKRAQSCIAVRGGLARTFRAEKLRPLHGDDIEELHHLAPMRRHGIGGESLEFGEVRVLGDGLVEEARQFARIGHALREGYRGMFSFAPAPNQRGEQQPPAQRGDGSNRAQILRRIKTQFLIVDIAERANARQQRGPAQHFGKDLAQRARRAPRRHQHQGIGESEGIGTAARNHPFAERACERDAGWNREDLRPRRDHQGSRTRSLRKASASSRPCGVPT